MAREPRCPTCRGSVKPRGENKYFPFCGKRCRLIDLGAWMSEEYRIPEPPADVAEDNPTPPGQEPPDDPPLLH